MINVPVSNPAIADIAARAMAAPARCGGTRVVLIDGPAGSGKTTLAHRIASALGGAQVLHADDMYEGWTGLPRLWEVLGGQVLEPLSRGQEAGFRRWDWLLAERAARIAVPAAPALVIEGVGTAERRARPYASVVLYVEAPWEVRLARGLERDGEAMRGEWERWQAAEAPFLAAEGTRAAADWVIDGTQPISTTEPIPTTAPVPDTRGVPG